MIFPGSLSSTFLGHVCPPAERTLTSLLMARRVPCLLCSLSALSLPLSLWSLSLSLSLPLSLSLSLSFPLSISHRASAFYRCACLYSLTGADPKHGAFPSTNAPPTSARGSRSPRPARRRGSGCSMRATSTRCLPPAHCREEGASFTKRDAHRGTSLIRNCHPVGPCSRTLPRALSWS